MMIYFFYIIALLIDVIDVHYQYFLLNHGNSLLNQITKFYHQLFISYIIPLSFRTHYF